MVGMRLDFDGSDSLPLFAENVRERFPELTCRSPMPVSQARKI